MSLNYTDLIDGNKNRVEIAIKRIQTFEPPEGYYVAFSGGKDSVVILDLVKKSGVKYDAHYNITGIDPPELFYFIRDNFPELERHRPEKTIWSLIVEKRMPPTRKVRYCCEWLKERGGRGRLVITGVRKAESANRSKRQIVEVCYNDVTKRYLHPIIDWSVSDVWDYIKNNGVKYCHLYDEGFKRLGCIMCPMNRNRKAEIIRWPKYKEKYLKAFDACLQKRRQDGLETSWEHAGQMWDWWLRNGDIKENPKQMRFFFE